MSDHVQKLAELAVRVGANVQPGQIVAVGVQPGKEELVRAIAAEAYKAGAKFVDPTYFDAHLKKARIEFADEDTLDFVPSWYGERMLALGEQRAARIALSGPVAPGLMEGLDPVRVGKDQLPRVKESNVILNDRTTNWSIVPGPTVEWARLVHPDLDDATALAKLWEQIVHVCRLDEDDPVAAWYARKDELQDASERLTARAFDALHYEGPGTDLTIGMLPGHHWRSGGMETVDGIFHMANLPTEEVFTSPDPERTEGIVTSTKPLVLVDGTVVRDLVVRFEGGRAVEITASTGQDTLRTITASDPGAARLGECALVDGSGRIGALDTVFYDTLLDENAASHIAFGVGFPEVIDGERGPNESDIHIDFMIGSPELTVTGITSSGERVPVLVGGDWQL